MKIALNWIKEYVKPGISTEQLIHKLTMAGLEVEEVVSTQKDQVLELEITPNRPDCLSMIGMAREISAILNKPLTVPKVSVFPKGKKVCDVDIKEPAKCARYIGIIINDVCVKPSPEKMKSALSSIGLRAINNIVDITNYSLMENGQPLHAFDLDKLEGGKIIVRNAKKGESITTLDGVSIELDPSILVIADAKKPVAIAGIMGGAETEVTASTKNILLESAYFDPILIRRTARKLGLSSDSSYRFERGVAYQGVEYGAMRAAQMISELASGKISATRDLKSGKPKTKQSMITISPEKINSYLGTNISSTMIKTGLKRLGFGIATAGKKMKIAAPHFRQDISSEVDIIEEVARMTGFDNIPNSLPQTPLLNLKEDVKIQPRNQLREALIGQGLNEVITFALIGREMLTKTKQQINNLVAVLNPLTKEQELMRPTLLPNMLSIAANNINRGQKELSLFECGKVYFSDGEKEVLSLLITENSEKEWNQKNKSVNNFYTLKGVLENAAGLFDATLSLTKEPQPFFEKGQSAAVEFNGKKCGVLGKVDEDVLRSFGIKEGNIFYCEVLIGGLLMTGTRVKKFTPISEFPAVTRDISVAVDQSLSYGEIVTLINKTGGSILKNVTFIEEYLGDKIADDQRGLVFSLTYQSQSRTLKEEEVTQAHNKILDVLTKEYQAVLR